jgi:pyruvate/2-oxoglutarate dehydrogenase complex dihydrolipoamide acyltransferase (E2) component
MIRATSAFRYLVASSSRTPRVSAFHSNVWAAKRITETVPALGESITEGTIAKWAKQEGDKVSPDEVVVVVETDKVTVDIKATHHGVILKHLATDNVEVGKPLYELEVDDTASASTGSAASPASTPIKTNIADLVTATTTSHDHSRQRKPLIRFLGKRSLLPSTHAAPADHSAVVKDTTTTTTTATTIPTIICRAPKRPQTGVDFHTLKDAAFYGRPKLSEKEISAIESGGAY